MHFQTSNGDTFGHSWLYRMNADKSCDHNCNETVDGTCNEELRVEADRMCALITNIKGRFKVSICST